MPFDEKYFHSHTYQHVSFTRFSQYWWSNRFYAILACRYGRGGRRLLEVGSGLGHLVGRLQNSFAAHGVDINPWAVRESQKVAAGAVFQVASAEALPFRSNTFDVVVSKHNVEHLQKPDIAISEIGRVTSPGGVLILSTPNLSSPMTTRKKDAWIGYRDPTHIALKTQEEWLNMIRGVGFRIRKAFSDGFWDVPYVNGIPNLIQKLFFGAPGGFQAVTGLVFIPVKMGESLIVVASKEA